MEEQYYEFGQPDLTAIRTYFTRWLIRTTSLVQIHTIFAKLYVFYELPIRMNLYEWPTPNPAPKPTRHWGLDKSYKIVRVRSYEFVRISHLIKYVWIGREIALVWQVARKWAIYAGKKYSKNKLVKVMAIFFK